jgi:integrase
MKGSTRFSPIVVALIGIVKQLGNVICLIINHCDQIHQPRREIRNVPITLEWVVLPNGIYFRTICKNGVPLPDPARYLLSYAYPDHGSTQTIRTYAQYLLPFYKWLDRQGITLEGFTLVDLKRYRRELTLIDTAEPPLLRKGAESASSTIYYAMSTTVRYILWAMEVDDTEPFVRIAKGYVPSRRRISFSQLTREEVLSLTDPILPDPKRELTKYLTQDQLDQCRKWIMDTYSFDEQLQLRNRAIFELLWDGALRKGSLLGLQTKNINWMECTILVSFDAKDYRDAWYRKKSNYRTAKTGEYLPIVSDQTIQWLDRYRQEARPVEAVRLKHGLFFCEHAPKNTSHSDHGQPLCDETLKYFFELMSKSLEEGGTGIHITPHMLRHTWATMALNDGLPEEVIQHQLGHAFIMTTEKYSRAAPAKRRQILKEWRESHPERYGGNIR